MMYLNFRCMDRQDVRGLRQEQSYPRLPLNPRPCVCCTRSRMWFKLIRGQASQAEQKPTQIDVPSASCSDNSNTWVIYFPLFMSHLKTYAVLAARLYFLDLFSCITLIFLPCTQPLPLSLASCACSSSLPQFSRVSGPFKLSISRLKIQPLGSGKGCYTYYWSKVCLLFSISRSVI